ncbi:DUF952 domain-containing protein [Candidatus Saccharibacteria bacterium]|nr:DUF952 domain-containing protein [Candidatus Saccharibacteria bacterium]
MRTIIVTTTTDTWATAQKIGEYTQSTVDLRLEEVGFIHCTKPDQTVAMLNRRLKNRDDLLLLLVDVDKVVPEVKFEATQSGTPGLFPHIYGPLNVDAVYGTILPTKDSSGNFVASTVLSNL